MLALSGNLLFKFLRQTCIELFRFGALLRKLLLGFAMKCGLTVWRLRGKRGLGLPQRFQTGVQFLQLEFGGCLERVDLRRRFGQCRWRYFWSEGLRCLLPRPRSAVPFG